MKKVFALVLAVAMVMSLSAVSFAATKNVVADGIQFLEATPYEYNADKNTMSELETYQYGKAMYFALVGPNDAYITDSEMVEGLKVKLDYEMGKDLVAENGVSLVKKEVVYDAEGALVPNTASTYPANVVGSAYIYFVEVKIAAKETTSDADLVATIVLNKSKKGDAKIGDAGVVDVDGDGVISYKVKDLETDISANIGYKKDYIDSGAWTDFYINTDSTGTLEPETYYLFKYNYDEECEFEFGLEPNEGTFTVDVSGQGKNLLYYDTKLDDGIADANPDAKIFALNFNNTKFNRTGEFMYEGEDFEYAYQLMADGSLKLLGEFDGEEITFKTRVLGSYLFSDVELVAAPAAVEEPSVDVPTVDVTNPATGAAC